MTKALLQVGDVFDLTDGMVVNLYGDSRTVIIGQRNTVGIPQHEEVTLNGHAYQRFWIEDVEVPQPSLGEYSVIHTELSGGGMTYDGGFPDGHKVIAANVKTGERIWFYQSGCFTAVNEFVPIIRSVGRDEF